MWEDQRTRLAKIVVPVCEAEADASWQACLWVGNFVELAINEAGYELDELPEDAIRFADLWDYLGGQSSSGHALICENPVENAGSWRRAAQLLDALGLTGHSALLREFTEFSIETSDRVNELYAEGEETAAGELFWPFDDRFRALRPNYEDLLVLLRDWLLRQPWIEISHDDAPATAHRLRRSIPPHPLGEQRLAARKRQRAAENLGEAKAFLQKLSDRLDNKHPK